jgi:hypothetical protein
VDDNDRREDVGASGVKELEAPAGGGLESCRGREGRVRGLGGLGGLGDLEWGREGTRFSREMVGNGGIGEVVAASSG